MSFVSHMLIQAAGVILFSVSLLAQSPTYQAIKRSNGLPDRNIFSIFQQESGALIVGSGDGIYQYDGFEFEAVPFPINKCCRDVLGMQKMSNGQYCFLNSDRMLFEYSHDSIQQLVFDEEIPSEEIRVLYRYTPFAKDLLFADADYLFQYDWENKSLIRKIPYKGKIFSAAVDTNGAVWLVKRDTIKRYPIEGAPQSFYSPEFATNSVSTILFRTGNGNMLLWLGGKGLLLGIGIEDEQLRFETRQQIPAGMTCYYVGEPAAGTIGIGTDNGLWLVDDSTYRHLFPNETIYFATQDREHNYWVATHPGELRLIKNIRAVSYSHEGRELPLNSVKEIIARSGDSLIVRLKDGNLGFWGANGFQFLKLPKNRYRRESLIQIDETIHWFDPSPASKLYEILPTGKLSNNPVQTPFNLYYLAHYQGDIFLGINSKRQLVKLEKQNNQIVETRVLKEDIFRTRFFLEPEKQRLWIGMRESLGYFEGDSLYDLSHHIQEPIVIRDFAQTDDQTVWVSNNADGIYGFRQGGVIKKSVPRSWHPSEEADALAAQGNHLWLGTSKGLYFYHADSLRETRYGFKDGLICDDIICLLPQEEKLWVGTTEGLSVVELNENGGIDVHRTPPKIELIKLKISSRDTSLHPVYHLTHDQNDLQLDFKAYAFRSAKDSYYRYQMLGLDTSWYQLPANAGYVNFYDLGSGEYHFTITAVNGDGLEAEEPISILFVIEPPFWERFELQLTAGLLIILLISWGISRYLKRVKRKAYMERELILAELKALKAQMNPHFLFNALQSIQEFVAREEKTLANDYLRQFAKLTRLVLEHSGQRRISLANEVDFLNSYLRLERLRLGGDCQFEIELSPQIEEEYTYIPPMIVQPLVENSIKHGLRQKKGEKRLRVEFRLLSEQQLECVITDNGIGRKASAMTKQRQRHLSRGSEVTQKRLALLSQELADGLSIVYEDLYNVKGEANGTRATMIIPFELI
ncbi:MAG: histidine kinase [Bacteroidota bacterium]